MKEEVNARRRVNLLLKESLTMANPGPTKTTEEEVRLHKSVIDQ